MLCMNISLFSENRLSNSIYKGGSQKVLILRLIVGTANFNHTKALSKQKILPK